MLLDGDMVVNDNVLDRSDKKTIPAAKFRLVPDWVGYIILFFYLAVSR